MKKFLFVIAGFLSASLSAYAEDNGWRLVRPKTEVYCGTCGETHFAEELTIDGSIIGKAYAAHFEKDSVVIGCREKYGDVDLLYFHKIPNHGFHDFLEFYIAHKDSIDCDQAEDFDVDDLNYVSALKAENLLHKKHPYCYVECEWTQNSAGGICPTFSIINTSNKTIKYITFYFQIYNPVGDVCAVQFGHKSAKGVGPIEKDKSATFDWSDDPVCYASKSASDLKVTKVTIQYMDNTYRTLTKGF